MPRRYKNFSKEHPVLDKLLHGIGGVIAFLTILIGGAIFVLFAGGRGTARFIRNWDRHEELRPEFSWTHVFPNEVLVFLLAVVVAICLGVILTPLTFWRNKPGQSGTSENNRED